MLNKEEVVSYVLVDIFFGELFFFLNKGFYF